MKTFLKVFATAAVAAAVCATSAGAAPIRGGTFESGTWDTPDYLYFLTPGGSLSGGLTALGCPFVPRSAEVEAQTSSLAYAYHGWVGPMRDADTNPNQSVLLRTRVTGTVQDAAGNAYHLAGNFLDSTTHYLFENDLLFDGIGHVTLAGPGGVVVGTAELRVVTAPNDYAFVFTQIEHCGLRG